MMIRKILIGVSTALLITAAVLAALWQNAERRNAELSKAMEEVKRDTSSWRYDIHVVYQDTSYTDVARTRYRTVIDTTASDTVRKDSLIYIYPADSIQYYAMVDTLGDWADTSKPAAIVKDSLKVKGELLTHRHYFEAQLLQRQRTITNTRTKTVYPARHRLYLGGTSAGVITASYAHPYFQAGYGYDARHDMHQVSGALNVVKVFQELFHKDR
jgi:hypothetical protein